MSVALVTFSMTVMTVMSVMTETVMTETVMTVTVMNETVMTVTVMKVITVTVMKVITVTVMTVLTVTVMTVLTVKGMTVMAIYSNLPVLRVVEDVIKGFWADIREYRLKADHPENKGARMSGRGILFKVLCVTELVKNPNLFRLYQKQACCAGCRRRPFPIQLHQ